MKFTALPNGRPYSRHHSQDWQLANVESPFFWYELPTLCLFVFQREQKGIFYHRAQWSSRTSESERHISVVSVLFVPFSSLCLSPSKKNSYEFILSSASRVSPVLHHNPLEHPSIRTRLHTATLILAHSGFLDSAMQMDLHSSVPTGSQTGKERDLCLTHTSLYFLWFCALQSINLWLTHIYSFHSLSTSLSLCSSYTWLPFRENKVKVGTFSAIPYSPLFMVLEFQSWLPCIQLIHHDLESDVHICFLLFSHWLPFKEINLWFYLPYLPLFTIVECPGWDLFVQPMHQDFASLFFCFPTGSHSEKEICGSNTLIVCPSFPASLHNSGMPGLGSL